MSTKRLSSSNPIGILATAHYFPPQNMRTQDVFQKEGVNLSSKVESDIGIEQVHIYNGEWRSEMALTAAKECILRANLKPTDIDIVVDFSVLPEDYVVPSWCLSNKIQAEIGATNAFNLGFGGGGTTSLLVAIKSVSSLIKAENDINTALLIASDVSIPNNRVINSENPMTILGDGASAMIISQGIGACEILGTELWSDGKRHDVFYIPGGGLASIDDPDLYRVQIHHEKYSATTAFNTLKNVSKNVVQYSGVEMHEVVNFIGPNISAKDQALFADTFGLSEWDIYNQNLKSNGHVQATDIVVNLSQLLEQKNNQSRDLGLICSHGWGFLCGATLIHC